MSAINTRSAAWEDRITWRVEDNVIYLKELGDDSKLQEKLQTDGALILVSGSVVVRGKDDKDDGACSKIVEYVKGNSPSQAGFRLESSKGMETGKRVWVLIYIKDRPPVEKKDSA